ncbi:hypothetical protein NC652_003548 [Populus alba x Populus x berolinensis]|nr:hypothetical protein NC652_003548 [Populus alba x Populus x berolinensis]
MNTLNSILNTVMPLSCSSFSIICLVNILELQCPHLADL